MVPIVMFDNCKFYPIWIPPCKGDILEQISEEVIDAVISLKKARFSLKEISEAIRSLENSINNSERKETI